ncbi:MAG: hypothetical protein U0T31_05765 [Chitinophagales bacterium]
MFKYTSLIILLFSCINLYSQDDYIWREEKNINNLIYDAPLELTNGETSSILQLAAKKPLIVALVFSRCVGVCNPLLLQLKDNIRFDFSDKEDFTILVVSFDAHDTKEDMQRMSERFQLSEDKKWAFATTSAIEELNTSLDFKPIWNEKIQQFNHDALLVGVNSKGFITKNLIGLRRKNDLKLLEQSIKNKYIPTYQLPSAKSRFSCFNYDPKTGKNKPGLGLLLIASPAIFSFLFLFVIRFLVRNKKQ